MPAESLKDLITREKKTHGGVFTIKSKKTGTEYSYKISRSEYNGYWYTNVKVEGPNRNFIYLGWYKEGKLFRGRKVVDTPSALAIAFILRMIELKRFAYLNEKLELFHSGKCVICGKMLTDSNSIKLGIGPVCAGTQ